MEGWIKIYRKIEDWEWFTDSYTVHVFLYLLIHANVQDSFFRGNQIKRGQLITTRKAISSDTGIPESSVYRSLKKLSATGEIEQQTNNKWTAITIYNYDKYNPSTIQEVNNNANNERTPDLVEEEKEERINNNTLNASAYVRTHEATPQTPLQAENWRHLSSVRRFELGNNPDAIAEYKKKLIAEELSLIAAEIKMPKDAQEKFLTKWCEHNPGREKIKAEFEPTFNVRDRAIQWMGWWKQGRPASSQADEERKKRLNVNEKWGR